MVLTPLSTHMGFIILNQPVSITVGIVYVSGSSASDLACLISIIKFNFSRFFNKIIAFLIYRFFLSVLLSFLGDFIERGQKAPTGHLLVFSALPVL